MINCCKDCVPPKRTPTCKFDGTCTRYEEAKKKHDAERAEQYKKRQESMAIYISHRDKVEKAMQKRRSYKR